MKRGGFGGMGNMQQLMQQAMQMQKKMEEVQNQLATKVVEAASGGGAVKVTVSGKQEILTLAISPEALEGADAEMLSDMVKSAVNEGMKKSLELKNQMMSAVSGGGMPGMF